MRRIAEFDGVRGLAAVAVVAYHIFMSRLPWGWAAVDVFFVLSGFLITGIVLEHGRSPGFLWAFYMRRGLRIWPIYYLLLLIMAVCWVDDAQAIPYYLTYTQRLPYYWGGEMPPWTAMGHTWTLAMEEQFYLIWPALVLLAGKRWTGPLALALAVGSILARLAGFHHMILAGRCDGFAFGGLLAALVADADVEHARQRVLAWACGAGAIAVGLIIALGCVGCLVDSNGPYGFRWHVTTATIASFSGVALVAVNTGHRSLVLLRTPFVVYLGSISYGLYLYQYPILMSSEALRKLLGVGPGPILWSTEVLLTAAAAVVSWHLIEKPILRLKDFVPYRSPHARMRGSRTATVEPIEPVAAQAM
ncbi:MAG: acyltransferase [Isosphaeraceae bacterium]|nr:acyltransferase [Isosphaeraceae bacterium]